MRKHLDALVPSLIGVALLGMAVFWFLLPQTEKLVLDEKRSTIRELTQVAWSMLNTYYLQEKSGLLTRQEAQQRAADCIRQFRFGPNRKNYFWVADKSVHGVVHPHRDFDEGRDLSMMTDISGARFVKNAVESAIRHGEAPVRYYWPVGRDQGKYFLKIAHVRYFEPWGWIIGTGMFIRDVEDRIAAIQKNLIVTGIGILAVMVLVGGYFAKRHYKAAMREQEAEQETKAANDRSLAVLTASPSPMVVYDRQGMVEYVNPAFTKVFGWTAEEVRGRKIDYVPPECEEQTQEAICHVFEDDNREAGMETQRLTKDGRCLEVSLSASSFNDAHGNVTGAVVSLTDITHLKMVQGALRKSEESFRALTENSLDTIMRLDRRRRHLYVNPSVENQTGISPVDFIGQSHRELGFPEDLCRLWDEAIEKVFVEKSPNRIEFQLPSKIWIDWQLIPEFNEGGEVEAVIASARDISERKKAESDRRAWDAKMRQSQKLEAIGTLAGGIAHDFNNILAAISGYAELASRDGVPRDACQGHMTKILAASDRAKALIKQILAFSQVSDDVLEPVRVDIVAREVLQLIRATVPANVEISSSLEVSTRVLADPTQIHQVLVNLCTNAGQAMEETGGVMSITMKEMDLDSSQSARYPDLAPGKYLSIKVSDTGTGIDPESGERIFEPFFSTKSPDKGTGLGLAVAHGVVKKLGGTISYYSELGQGTAFHVLLPAMAESTDQEHGMNSRPNPNGQERVLLVDDEQDIVDAGRQILEAFGYNVSATNSSLEALEMITGSPFDFDVVVTDKTMPKLSGLELARSIRDVRPDLPVILSTGFTGADQEELARAVGISKVLLKPFSSVEIGMAIRQILDQNKTNQN